MAWYDIEKPWWIPAPQPSEVNVGQIMIASAQLAQNRRKMAIDERQNDERLAIERQLTEARKLAIESSVQQEVSKNQTVAMAQKGSAELSNFISEMQATNGWGDPKNKARFWAIGGRYPMIPDETMNGFWDRSFKVAEDRAIKQKEHEITANAPTADVKNTEFLRSYRMRLDEAKASGDPAAIADAQQVLSDFQSLISPSSQIVESFGQDGQLQSRITTGKSGTKDPNGLSVSTTSKLDQQKFDSAVAIEQGVSLRKLLSANPESIGVRGVVNQSVLTEMVGQFMPEMKPKDADKITDVRSFLTAWRENYIKSIKADSQINIAERKALEESVPRLGVNEEIGSALQKIKTAIENRRKAIRTTAEQAGRPVPDYALTVDEILAKRKAGELTEEKALELLMKYHD